MTAAALLVSETSKGGEITIRVPHSFVTLMEYKRQYWLTNTRMVSYQSMLCKNPQVKLKPVWTLNPATLLPSASGSPDLNCVEVFNEVFSSHPNLCEQPLAQPNHKPFTAGRLITSRRKDKYLLVIVYTFSGWVEAFPT
jgi:hypothetical protein